MWEQAESQKQPRSTRTARKRGGQNQKATADYAEGADISGAKNPRQSNRGIARIDTGKDWIKGISL